MGPNRDRLVQTARRLQPLLAEVVFVGGQMAELLVTDPGALGVRPTDDVDVIVGITTRGAYHDEVGQCPTEVREFIRSQTRAFLQSPWAEEIVESAVPDARRFPDLRVSVLVRFQSLANG